MKWSLSIAHTRRGALAALGCLPGVSLGIDLVEPRQYGSGFADVWFTPAERRWLPAAGSRGQAILWAIKEAAYKAVNAGESFDPRLIEIAACPGTVPFFTQQEYSGQKGFQILRSKNRPSLFLLKIKGKPLDCLLILWPTIYNEIAVFALVPDLHKNVSDCCAAKTYRPQTVPFFAQQIIRAVT